MSTAISQIWRLTPLVCHHIQSATQSGCEYHGNAPHAFLIYAKPTAWPNGAAYCSFSRYLHVEQVKMVMSGRSTSSFITRR